MYRNALYCNDEDGHDTYSGRRRRGSIGTGGRIERRSSEVLRRLIRHGLTDWRKEKALGQLRDHTITLRKAADLAGVSYVEMLSLAAEEGIDVGYTTEDLERDFKRT
jgi:predicted HTH domain antitoxin